MFLLSPRRVLTGLFLSALLTFCSALSTFGGTAEGVQIEFPVGGKLRVENTFGSVTAESWSQKHIYVTTTEGAVASSRSSVVIENRNGTFVIRVVRRPGASAAPIDLNIMIPATAHVELVTRSGGVSLRNVPASATVKSGAGDVWVELESANVDIAAKSVQGFVKSKLPNLLTETGHVLQARLGTGSQTLRIESVTGNIALSLAADASSSRRSDAPTGGGPGTLNGQTTLTGSGLTGSGLKGAGTPAPALDTQELDEGDVVRVDSQLVTLNMSVIDRNTNRGVVGLTQPDFKLFENGNEQKILQFDSSAAPFDLLLAIDISGSTREVLNLIRAAALRFVNAARPSDRIGVIAFAGQASVISPLTLDRSVLREQITAMDTVGGDTKLYDAMDFAVNQSLQDGKNRRRTAIILMSDGLDGSIPGVRGDGSKLLYSDLLNRLNEFDGVLYTLWLNTYYEALNPEDTQPEAFDAGHDRMEEMADTGGGVFYEVKRLEDLAGSYERVVADLGTVYSLSYRPSDKSRDGKWRAIRVNVATRPSAIARGKRGYYAN